MKNKTMDDRIFEALTELKIHLEEMDREPAPVICHVGKSWSEILDQKHKNEVYHFSIKPFADRRAQYVVTGIRGTWGVMLDLDRASSYAKRVTNNVGRARIRVYLTPAQREIVGERA